LHENGSDVDGFRGGGIVQRVRRLIWTDIRSVVAKFVPCIARIGVGQANGTQAAMVNGQYALLGAVVFCGEADLRAGRGSRLKIKQECRLNKAWWGVFCDSHP
jgi:hypothetical protein